MLSQWGPSLRQEFKLIVGLDRGDDGLDPRRNKQRRRWYPSTTSDEDPAGDPMAARSGFRMRSAIDSDTLTSPICSSGSTTNARSGSERN
jgi:hypothetical protein